MRNKAYGSAIDADKDVTAAVWSFTLGAMMVLLIIPDNGKLIEFDRGKQMSGFQNQAGMFLICRMLAQPQQLPAPNQI